MKLNIFGQNNALGPARVFCSPADAWHVSKKIITGKLNNFFVKGSYLSVFKLFNFVFGLFFMKFGYQLLRQSLNYNKLKRVVLNNKFSYSSRFI